MTRPEWLTSGRHPFLEPPRPTPDRALSPDARRTARNRQLLADRVHPATYAALLDPEWGFTCRDCAHATHVSRGNTNPWKCDRGRLGLSHSAASDIRVSWPACTLLTIDPEVTHR